jgi:hypothetical protein
MSAAELTSIEVRRAGLRDEPAILELLALLYGDTLDVRTRFRWLYEGNPDGHALTWLAIDRETRMAVGLTSLFPRRVLVHGTERRGSIGGDAYVRPAYRRRGIVTALHRACVAEMRPLGVELMYGPPEPHNLRALQHVGSRVVARVRRYVRILTPRSWGLLGARLAGIFRPRASHLSIEPARTSDARVLAVWERARHDLPISPVRDAAFYAWRFARCPSGAQRPYLAMDGPRPLAAFVLERSGARSAIVDLVAPREAWDDALSAILAALGDDEAVWFKLNDRGPVAGRLPRHGFIPRDAKPFQVLVSPLDQQASAMASGSSWYYTTGDGDVDRVL